MKTRMILATAAAAALTLAACGDDDTASEATTVAPATTQAPATTAPATTAAPVTTAAPATTEASASGDASSTVGGTATDDPYCALALEMFNQNSLPTPEQLTQAQELAPPEIHDAASVAAPPLIAAGGDPVAFFAAYAQDDVEQAVEQLNAYEDEHCGTENGSNDPPEGASREVEPDATQVDVVASDYMFDMPDTLAAGRTSFVLTNQGHEAHFLEIVKLAEGATLEQALAAEDPGAMLEGDWSTGLAAPDGVDDEVITFDLEPGNYAALCFISGPDGTPHAFMGMQKEFTVS